MLKRITSVAMAVLLILCGMLPHCAALADGMYIQLVNQQELKIAVTGAKLVENDTGDSLWLYVTAENGTGREIDIRVQDAYLDGTEVKGYGLYDLEPGETKDDFIMFKALEGESSDPLHDPTSYSFRLEVKDSDSFELLYTVPVQLIGPFPMGTEAPVYTTPKPTATPKPTQRSVYLPLQFFEGAYIQWEDLDNDRFKIRVQVENTDTYGTIRAFEIYMYATDVYGERIYGEDQVYYGTTKKTVGPEQIVYSDYLTVPCRSQVDRVYFGINRIVYDDGTVMTATDINYWYWTLD